LKLARTIWLGFWLKGRTLEKDSGVEAEEAWLVESFLSKDGVGVLSVGVLTDGVRGPSKSQETPCLWQLPQTGCTAGCQVELTGGNVERYQPSSHFIFPVARESVSLVVQKPSKPAARQHTVLATLTPRLALLMRSPGRHGVAVKRMISRNGPRDCLGRVLHIDTSKNPANSSQLSERRLGE